MKTAKDCTILVVDDEQDLKEVLAYNFKRKGFKVLAASSGSEAFELIKVNQVDLVLSDIRMPNGDGVDLLTQIRKAYPELPVVMFITGFSDVTETEALQKGASAVFTKPFDRELVFEQISKALKIA